jgi:hypothetical protein
VLIILVHEMNGLLAVGEELTGEAVHPDVEGQQLFDAFQQRLVLRL